MQISFFSRLFVKKRKITNPLLLKWIDVFTFELPNQEDFAILNRFFGDIFQNIKLKQYSHDEIFNIHEDDDDDPNKFLELKFELGLPIENIYWDIIKNIMEKGKEIQNSPDKTVILKSLYPIIFRFLIRFDCAYNANKANFFQNPTSDILFINSYEVIKFIYMLYETNIFGQQNSSIFEDCILILSDFLENIKQLFSSQRKNICQGIVKTFIESIFEVSCSIIQNANIIDQNYLFLIELCFLYFSFHSLNFGKLQFSCDELQLLLKGLLIIQKIDSNFFKKELIDFVKPIISGCVHFLSILSVPLYIKNNKANLNPKQYNDDLNFADSCFQIGISIIKAYTYFLQNNIQVDDAFCEILNGAILYFIIWCFDNYPLTNLPYQPKYHILHSADIDLILNNYNENDLSKLNEKFYFICEPTFDEPVSLSFQYFQNEYNKMQNQEIYEIPLIFLSDIKHASLTDSILSYIKSLILLENNNLSFFIGYFLDLLKLLFHINDIANETDFWQKNIDILEFYNLLENNIPISFLYFLVSIFNKCNSKRICNIFPLLCNSFNLLLQPTLFSPTISKWFDTNEYFTYIFDIRSSIFHFFKMCYREYSNMKLQENQNEKNLSVEKCVITSNINYSEMVFQILSCLSSNFLESYPQIFDDIVSLFIDFINIDIDLLIDSDENIKILEMLIKHSIRDQYLHLNLLKNTNNIIENDMIIKYKTMIEKCRIHIFYFFENFIKTNHGVLYFFNNNTFLQFIIYFLFEIPVTNFSISALKCCALLNEDFLKLNNFEMESTFKNFNHLSLLFRNFSELLKSTINNSNDEKWIKLLHVILTSFQDVFAINRTVIFPYLSTHQVLIHLSSIPSSIVKANPDSFLLIENMHDNDKKSIIPNNIFMEVIKDIFDVFIILEKENKNFAEYIGSSETYYSNITSALKLIIYDESVIDKFLILIFEKQLSISKLPEVASIKNYLALPFMFNSTTHLVYHSILMKFLSHICNYSVSNKLRVFQAHLPELIINYIQNFPDLDELSTPILSYENVKNSIIESLNLFSVVSQYVFSVETLFKCIEAMRVKENHRVWWTEKLISLFSEFIENDWQSSPSSFFYLDGKHTGFFIPQIPSSVLNKGWSFMCRFELDSSSFNNNYCPVLFYAKLDNGDCFSLSFKENKILITSYLNNSNYSRNNNEKIEIFINDFEIQSNSWYDLILSSDFNLYIAKHEKTKQELNHIKLNSKKLSLDFKQGFSSLSVGNVPLSSRNEAPLIANISVFYFFSQVFDLNTINSLISLPLSFVYGFSSSELKLESSLITYSTYNKSLPKKLFDNAFDSQMFLGVNARMILLNMNQNLNDKQEMYINDIHNNKCINISLNSNLKTIDYRGIAFPFSNNFLDIIEYSGGAKLFLHLFEQVNLKLYKHDNQPEKQSIFLLQLISLITLFFQRNKSLEEEFIKNNGFKAMAHELLKIDPKYFNQNILISIYSLYSYLNHENQSYMIDEIWFNISIWKRLNFQNQSYIYKNIFGNLIPIEKLCSHITVGELCAILVDQPDPILRGLLWKFLIKLAAISFSNKDQDNLFSFLFYDENVDFQIEALQTFYQLCENNVNNIYDVFERNNMFSPFIQLLKHDVEKVRLASLKIIFLLYQNSSFTSVVRNYSSAFNSSPKNIPISFSDSVLNASPRTYSNDLLSSEAALDIPNSSCSDEKSLNLLTNSNHFHSTVSPEKFDEVILKIIHNMSSENITDETWECIQSFLHSSGNDNFENIRFIIPMICSISQFVDHEKIRIFRQFFDSWILSDVSSISYLTEFNLWFLWTLYLFILASKSKYLFSDRTHDFAIIGHILKHIIFQPNITINSDSTLVQAEVKKIIDPILFLEWLYDTKSWNTMIILNSVFTNFLSDMLLSDYKALEVPVFACIVFEIFKYIFYISKKDKFSINIQLHHLNLSDLNYDDYFNKFRTELENGLILDDLIKDSQSNEDNISDLCFSMRVTEKGEWIDEKLAIKLAEFISKYADFVKNKIKVGTLQILKIPKILLSELFAFLISSIVQMNMSRLIINEILIYVQQYCMSQKIEMDSFPFKLITSAFARISLKYLKKEKCKIQADASDSNQNELNLNASIDNADDFISITNILNSFYLVYKSDISSGSKLFSKVNFADFDFCVSFLQENGQELSLWLENLNNLSSSISELYKFRHKQFDPIFEYIEKQYFSPTTKFSFSDVISENITFLKYKQRRSIGLDKKAYKKIKRAFVINGGPLSSNERKYHWKISQITDSHFRRLYVKPNRKFDLHKIASLKRDQSKNEEAKLEYLRWMDLEVENDDERSSAFQLLNEQKLNLQVIYQFPATLITISAVYDGNFSINKDEIIFDGTQTNDEPLISIEKSKSNKTVEFKLNDLIWVLHRSYLHINRGLEFFCQDGRSYFLYFSTNSDRYTILKFLADVKPKNLTILQKENVSSQKLFNEQKFTEQWVNKEISTYDYLMYINLFSGRSFNDLSQYPIFPWILKDYESSNLNLQDKESFRDLSKPIGALNEARLNKLKKEMKDVSDENESCLYHSHYSTAYYVLHYMIRMEPFTTMHISMQDGKFDHPNRLFYSIGKAWNLVTSTANDFRELIPEFFTFPDFLSNSEQFDLGLKRINNSNSLNFGRCAQNDGDVYLPNWAKDPVDFIQKHRQALECDFVGNTIGNWIDLIFGYKQDGQNSIESNNRFHKFCYPSIVETEKVKKNHELLLQIQQYAGSFGIIPKKLFNSPHPNRQINNESGKKIRASAEFGISKAFRFESNIEYMSFSQNSNLISNIIYAVTNNSLLLKLNVSLVNNEINIKASQDDLSQLPSRANSVLISRFSSTTKCYIPYGTGKSILIFPKHKLLAATSPSEDSLHIFSFTSNLSLSHIFSFRQHFSLLQALSSAGDSMLAVLCQDGSILVWDLNDGSYNNSAISNSYNINYDPIYRVNHHFVQAVDISASKVLRLVVSIDISRRIVLAELSTGKFIRSFYLNDYQSIPYKILLLNSGFIVSICEHRSNNDIRSTIQMNALDSTLLSMYDHSRRVTSLCPIDINENGKSYIAISFEDGFFILLSCPEAQIIHTKTFPSKIISISHLESERLLLLSNNNNQIFSIDLDM